MSERNTDMQSINRALNSARAQRTQAIRLFFSRTQPPSVRGLKNTA
jgi:hypothetical protein